MSATRAASSASSSSPPQVPPIRNAANQIFQCLQSFRPPTGINAIVDWIAIEGGLRGVSFPHVVHIINQHHALHSHPPIAYQTPMLAGTGSTGVGPVSNINASLPCCDIMPPTADMIDNIYWPQIVAHKELSFYIREVEHP